MPTDLSSDVVLALVLAALWLVGGLIAVVQLRASRGRSLGTQLAHEPGARRMRWIALAVLVGAAIWVGLAGLPAATAGILIGLLVLGAVVNWVRPASGERECGSTGVRHSWHVLGFSDVSEWRLTGEHLRFRLFGEWTAAPLPEGQHEAVRTSLTAVAGDRESRFDR